MNGSDTVKTSADREGPIFLNLSNHPSSRWEKAQERAALALAGPGSTVRDLQFPAADPRATCAELDELAQSILADVPQSADFAMVSGDFTLTVLLVMLLQERGVTCVAATSDRVIRSEKPGEKITQFTFVQFRRYPLIQRATE